MERKAFEEKRDIDGWYCHYTDDHAGNRIRAAHKLDEHNNILDRAEVVMNENNSKSLLIVPSRKDFSSAVVPATVIEWLLQCGS